ncbi:putative lysosomal cobalamin transporter [Linnemannia zychae]|nr:putative lysosomal cobalamin transporter [Linnemannia zychae]
MPFVGAWGLYGLIGAVPVYYSDRQDREPFAMLVTVLALTLCLTTVALFPVDIFMVSRIMDPSTGLRYEWATDAAVEEMQQSVQRIYAVAYGLIASFCFFWIPLAYFYFEELADEGQTTCQRLWASFKYTLFFILVAAILLLTGLLMKPNGKNGGGSDGHYRGHDVWDLSPELDWLEELLGKIGGMVPLAFVAGVLALAGMVVLIFYTAPGLSLLPFYLLAGAKSLPASVEELETQLDFNRAQQNTILNRHPMSTGIVGNHGGTRQLSDRNRERISKLAQEEILLENRLRLVLRVRDSCWYRCLCIIRPFQILLGLAGSILTVLLVGSIAVTTIGQLDKDLCGAPCGFIFGRDLPNPLNMVLVRLSPYFPADYAVIVMIILYMFWATTKGIISLGIRFLWVHLYRFRRGATQPQGLLAATMLLMLSLAALSYTLTMAAAPEYSMFGSQKYCNNTIPIGGHLDCSSDPSLIISCHIGAPPDLCTPTVTSKTVLQVLSASPILGVAFYATQWGFLGFFVLAFIYNTVYGCWYGFGEDALGIEDGDEEEMDLEDSEARRLLSGGLSSEDARRRVRRRGLMIPRSENNESNEQAYSPGGYMHGQGQGYGGGKGRQWPKNSPSYGAATRNNGYSVYSG